MDNPTVGRIVHVKEVASENCLAAVVAAVNEDTINVGYFSRTGGARQAQDVPEGKGGTTIQWHWPERA